jgi:hypothetical protein
MQISASAEQILALGCHLPAFLELWKRLCAMISHSNTLCVGRAPERRAFNPPAAKTRPHLSRDTDLVYSANTFTRQPLRPKAGSKHGASCIYWLDECVERRRCHLRLCRLAINTPCAADREHARAILWIHHWNAAGMKIAREKNGKLGLVR